MHFNAIPIKISAGFFVEMDKLIVKFILKWKNLKEPKHFERGELNSILYLYIL